MINKLWENKYLLAAVCFCLGIAAGLAMYTHLGKSQVTTDDVYPVRENRDYTFISPLLFYQVPSAANEYKPLASKIRSLISNGDPALTASVYYRELKNGRWFGINENEKYTPASLLKVVVMIAYFKKAEIEPSILSQRILFSKAIQSLIGSIPYDQGTELKLNTTYLVSDLIDRMIIASDNGATYALISKLDRNVLGRVFKDLDLKNPEETGREYTMSTQDYAGFFRILYNATYLNRTMSERALALLSKTNFKEGIVAGVSPLVRVSHKYGEAVLSSDKGTTVVELHDCGIVYYPKDPYLLCIMTRAKGLDRVAALDTVTALIEHISHAIYEDVDK